jgi:hypothetical protein
MTSRDDPMMVALSFLVLDKFYSVAGLPAVALDYKDRAYFARHAWAVSVYFGLGRLDDARHHLQKAAGLDAAGLTTVRFLQSLAYAGGRTPTESVAREATSFVLREMQSLNVPTNVQRRLRAKARLMLASHTSGGGLARMRRMARALLRSPQLVLDREMWGVAARLVSRGRRRATQLEGA